MATNSLLTDAKITKEAMRILHNNLGFIKGVNREYSPQFAKTGAKIGNTINVRKPNRYLVSQGPAITPQGQSESSVALTLGRQWVVPMTFSSAELALSIDEFSNRYIKPAISKLASQIDLECLRAAVTGFYGTTTSDTTSSEHCAGAGPVNFVIGTPGTTPGTAGGSATGLLQYNAPQIYLNAGKILDYNAAPRDNQRTCLLDPSANASSIGSLSGLFNPQGVISEQYRSGLLGNALGMDFVMDQNVVPITTGTATSIGNITLTDDTATCSTSVSTGTVKAGQSFTVTGYYMVNPETQQNTGILQQFTFLQDYDFSATTTGLKISPTPKLTGSTVANGNTYTSTGAVLGASAATLTLGTVASTVSPQNLAFHKDAFTFGTADLEIPNGIAFGARETFDGISMRIIRDYDVMSDFMVCRIDVLGGFSVLRPELAVRIAG